MRGEYLETLEGFKNMTFTAKSQRQKDLEVNIFFVP